MRNLTITLPTTRMLSLLLICLLALPSLAGITSLASVASDGTQGNAYSELPSLSADGRYVAFNSGATTLVPGDTNGNPDVFVRDMVTGMTTRVSVASDGTQANGPSYDQSISADGRYVTFQSQASNLVAGDTNGQQDIFVHDRVTGTTTRMSVASDGTQGNSVSSNPDISADGRYVVFSSHASTLVPEDTNSNPDIFVRDRVSGTTTRVSVASDGTQKTGWNEDPAISADGRYVAFYSGASTLVPGDTNAAGDIFVHDCVTGITTRVSIASDGTQGNGWSGVPAMSGDGRYVTFESEASTLVPGDTNNEGDIFVHDRTTGTTTRVSVATNGTQGNGWSGLPAMSGDGRYVAFESEASTLVLGDTNAAGDIYLHDRATGVTKRVSVASDGTQANDGSYTAALSADGRLVAFQSDANNLVPGDTNGRSDVFLHNHAGAPLSAVQLITDLITPQRVDTPISLTASATGGTAVEYLFRVGTLVNGRMTWVVVEPYGADATATWTPTVPGQYTLAVWAREVGSTKAYDVYATKPFRIYGTAITAVTLGTAPLTPCAVGSRVTLTASATGGGPVEYQFRVGVKTGATMTWTVLRNYSTSPTCTWTPAENRYYTLSVYVRNVGNPVAFERYAAQTYQVLPKLSRVLLTTAPFSPQSMGTPVTLTAQSVGGARVEYQFRVGYAVNGVFTWTVVRNYATTASCTWTPTAARNFVLAVWAREVGSVKAYDVYASRSYTVRIP